MNSKLTAYENSFLQFYTERYDVAYIKVKNNTGIVPTLVCLYNANKRVIKIPTFNGVTVKNMFFWLKANKLYAIDEIISKGSEDKIG